MQGWPNHFAKLRLARCVELFLHKSVITDKQKLVSL